MFAMLRAAILCILPVYCAAAPLQDRFVWLFDLDFAKPADLARAERILGQGAAHGINGAVYPIDVESLDDPGNGSAAGLDRLQQACDRLHVELIPAAFSFGRGGPFLNVNPNLAEGLPVRDALFVAGKDGTASLAADPPVAIPNGGFEGHKGNAFSAFGFQDAPGSFTFADAEVRHSGKVSVRITDFASDPHGHGRVHLEVPVHPHRCYRVTLWAKSRGLGPKDCFNVATLAPVEGKELSLAKKKFNLPPTSDWKRFTYLFNSGEYGKVGLYAGVWGGKTGTLWLDDWTIEEVGPVNLLRRPGTPVAVKGEDGAVYEEGKDFARFEDRGLHPWNEDRPAIALKLTPGSRITPGMRLRVSWYHPVAVYAGQVGVCMAEPQIYEIVGANAKAIAARLHPKRMLLNMDEIRVGGTCGACRGRNMGELLGESVSRIAKILREHMPGLEVYVWSDMFDPNGNAHGDYYHVIGDFAGSGTHLPKDIVMAVWGDDANPKSFEHFAGQGFKVLGACYYDADNLDQVKDWVKMAQKYPNVRGLMYTTWAGKYDLLPAFGDLFSRP